MTKSLDVLIDGELIGQLHDRVPLSFTYSDQCITGLVRSPIAHIIPLEIGEIATPAVHAFFENLLPEGDQRFSLENKHHVTSIFGLLEKAAWDSAGSVVLKLSGSSESEHKYIKKTWVQIAKIISGQAPHQEDVRASISGAQYKILLSIDEKDGSPKLPVGASPTTHILKPDIRRVGQKIWASALNETMMMKLAQKCGLETASVDYIDAVKSCLVKRYDRVVTSAGIKRIHQFDLCQLLKIPSGIKYEIDGGPNFAQCYEQVKQLSVNPVADCEHLLKWLFFNLFIGNNDTHAKNLSMVMTTNGYRLAPFYDLMCTSVYSGFSNDFALKIGRTFKPGMVNTKEVEALAKSVGVSAKYLLKLAHDISERIQFNFPIVVEEFSTQFGPQEKVMVERLSQEVLTICRKRISKMV